MELSAEPQLQKPGTTSTREDLCEYVAQLQLHMTLQARNLVPGFTNASDTRTQLLQETQSMFERQVSRQR
jgi:hypothetical protein